MRPLFLIAVLLSLTPAAFAGDSTPAVDGSVQADWLRDGVKDREREALTSQGWRLEEDGRALDPKTKAPATKAVLDKAVLDLHQGARRAALETVNLMLASGEPLSPADRTKIETLSPDLPPALVAAIFDPGSDVNAVKAMAGSDLAGAAAHFDGSRTLDERRAAAQPVAAVTPGPRVDLPYFNAPEKAVGEKLRASAAAEIGRDPFGKTVLARLKDKTGKTDLPPIVIEDQYGAVVAHYDFRRGAVVLDREAVVTSAVAGLPPAKASALRASLNDRAALMAYLEKHPETVTAFVKSNDAVLVHELTHAWQDRRDPIFREIARGNVPDVQPLEYEEEAYKTKNLYIQSKLKNDPGSVKMDQEFADYLEMMHGRASWTESLYKTMNDSSPSRALPLKTIQEVQAGRLAATKGRSVVTAEDQQAKALDLRAGGRGRKELDALAQAHAARMAALDDKIDGAGPDVDGALGRFYLGQARTAPRATDRSVLLEQAQRYAQASGNATLIEEVRKEMEKPR